MGEVLACRLCLSTHVKLFNMFKYRLDSYYENVTGYQLTRSDYIQDLCSMCSVLLVKTDSFRQMCQKSQELLKFAEMHQHLISTEYIESLKLNSSFQKLTFNNIHEIIECVHANEQIKEESSVQKRIDNKNNAIIDCVQTKEETTDDAYWDTWENKNLILAEEESSDEKPLSAKITSVTRKTAIKLEKEKKLNDNSVANTNTEVKSENYSDNDDVSNDFPHGEVDIIVLKKEQEMDNIQSKKTSLNYQNSLYKCDRCCKGFTTDLTDKNHMIRHDSEHAVKVEQNDVEYELEIQLGQEVTQAPPNPTDIKVTAGGGKSLPTKNKLSKLRTQDGLPLIRVKGMTLLQGIRILKAQKIDQNLNNKKKFYKKRVVCEVCGNKYLSQAALRYHQRVHTGVRPYQCTYCPKSYTMPLFLKIHTRSHTGERPYACNLCPKAFSDKTALNRHDRIHTGEKPYACPVCGKCFSQSNSVKIHVHTVHLKMPAPYTSQRRRAELAARALGGRGGREGEGREIPEPMEPIPEMPREEEVIYDLTYEEEVSHDLTYEEEVGHDLTYEEEVSHDLTDEEEVSHNLTHEEEVSHDLTDEEEVSHDLTYEEEVSQDLTYEEEVIYDLTMT